MNEDGPDRSTAATSPRIDTHLHLTGVGTDDSGCWVSPAFQSRLTFQILRRIHGITTEQMEESADSDWVHLVSEIVDESEIDYAVALGFDGVYRADGSLDEERSQMIVPPSWVFRSCHDNDHLLPGPSVNPFRADAMERLEECVDGGAVLIKWLPMTQGIDLRHPKIADFYRLLAEAGIPLLVHMGGERTFATIDESLNDVTLLRAPLDAGVPVICAHTGTRILFSLEPDQLPTLRGMFDEYPHLWVDNSGMCNPGRYAHLPALAEDSRIWERTLYGSDFPVPSNAIYFTRELGVKEVFEMEWRERNPIQRDVEIKRALGYPDRTLSRAVDVLANLDRWLTPEELGRKAEGS